MSVYVYIFHLCSIYKYWFSCKKKISVLSFLLNQKTVMKLWNMLFFFFLSFPHASRIPSLFTVASPKFPAVQFPNIQFPSSWTFIYSCKLELIRSVQDFATATDARLTKFADLCVFFFLQYKLEAGGRLAPPWLRERFPRREGKINK